MCRGGCGGARARATVCVLCSGAAAFEFPRARGAHLPELRVGHATHAGGLDGERAECGATVSESTLDALLSVGERLRKSARRRRCSIIITTYQLARHRRPRLPSTTIQLSKVP